MHTGKFASENHAGPKDVVDFLDLVDEESIEMTKRDAYEQVQALLSLIKITLRTYRNSYIRKTEQIHINFVQDAI